MHIFHISTFFYFSPYNYLCMFSYTYFHFPLFYPTAEVLVCWGLCVCVSYSFQKTSLYIRNILRIDRFPNSRANSNTIFVYRCRYLYFRSFSFLENVLYISVFLLVLSHLVDLVGIFMRLPIPEFPPRPFLVFRLFLGIPK